VKLLKTEAFTFEERQYEIYLDGNAWDFTVHIYLDGKPANGYSYSVSPPTAALWCATEKPILLKQL
jgi:hypothetical protein